MVARPENELAAQFVLKCIGQNSALSSLRGTTCRVILVIIWIRLRFVSRPTVYPGRMMYAVELQWRVTYPSLGRM